MRLFDDVQRNQNNSRSSLFIFNLIFKFTNPEPQLEPANSKLKTKSEPALLPFLFLVDANYNQQEKEETVSQITNHP
ncbi:hypothetical protein Pst134EA_002672 [Puccinia striiformis f. sp. tritici]|uniref:hypothetical protein n=1 Tax=Puccinia striiformis f. sp. tritici TaxID=168172 RepID=UPI0020072325|nr:hypothetical protein Pst134EA_002672 [Puccinia striiformis f. sp. tritici]KAH9464263.1 hypothetical protein Pst134EB_003794 [Puccinia striiformis f. sp. tritici]KAH9472044.1 hypothetical protein Pst134EA_002672 [Puccinia striiformis f. sp. tritici]